MKTRSVTGPFGLSLVAVAIIASTAIGQTVVRPGFNIFSVDQDVEIGKQSALRVEACASGLPCVTHDHPVLRWMTGPGGVGIDMAAPGVLGRTLTTALQPLGPLARQHCAANFGTDAVVGRILDYYRRVAAS